MRKTKRFLFWLISPFLAIAVLTIVGLAIRSPQLISICGIILFFILFWGFTFAHRMSEWLKSLHKAGFFHTRDARKTIDLIAQVSIRFALVIRGFFLSASFWIVDLYLSLCQGGITPFVDQIRGNLISTVLALALAGIDTARDKSVDRQGLPTRVMSTWGYFQFFRNFILLVSASQPEFFHKLNLLLSHPVWFLESPLKYQILRISFELGTLLTLTVPPLLGFIIGLSSLFHSKETPDSKNFSIALMAICGCLLTVPAFYLYVLLFGVPKS